MAVLFYTVKDLAERYQVKKSTLYAWAAQRKIPSRRINGCLRFPMNEIERWEAQLGQPIAPLPALVGLPRLPTTLDDIIASAKRAAYNPRPRGNQHKREPKKGGGNGAL